MEEGRQLTPKEKFDAEMKQINKEIGTKNAAEKEAGYSDGQVEELDEEVEAVEEAMDEQEKVVDKSMGQQKHTVTQEQFSHQKLEKQRKELAAKLMNQSGIDKEKLTLQQKKIMTQVLTLVQAGKVDDPVLKHLIDKKLDLSKKQAELTAEIKQAQMEIVQKMGKLADESMRNQGAVNTYNQDILDYVDKNPSVLEE